ncbi:MAG: beta-carotene hydroxylase [Bacteroidia bacterium]
MPIWIHILVFFLTFGFMEFMAWFTHKFVMHGFLWSLHKDHHHKDHESWFERNDTFFIFYAVISIGFFLLWQNHILEIGLAIGMGIFAYGLTYFLVHDIFIHQRFKMFRKAESRYGKAVRRAHKMHHKHLGKEHGECFGMLLFPYRYWKESKTR